MFFKYYGCDPIDFTFERFKQLMNAISEVEYYWKPKTPIEMAMQAHEQEVQEFATKFAKEMS